MNQQTLLNGLDNWNPQWDAETTAFLIQAAAAEIRRLSPLKSAPLTDEETAVVLEVFGRTDSEAEAGLCPTRTPSAPPTSAIVCSCFTSMPPTRR